MDATSIELAKLCQSRIASHRVGEWRIVFAVWVAIGAMTYLALDNRDALAPWTLIVLGAVDIAIAIVWFICWQIPISRACEQDEALLRYHLHRAQGLESEWPEIKDFIQEPWNLFLKPTTYGTFALTTLLLISSLTLIAASSLNEKPIAGKLEIRASGTPLRLEPTWQQN